MDKNAENEGHGVQSRLGRKGRRSSTQAGQGIWEKMVEDKLDAVAVERRGRGRDRGRG